MQALAPHSQNASEHTKRGDEINHHINDQALGPFLASGSEPYEGKAHVADGGVSQQALDIILANGGKGAEYHGGDRNKDKNLLPVLKHGGKGGYHDTDKERHGCDFWRFCKERCDRGWRTFIDIRRPHMEGH